MSDEKPESAIKFMKIQAEYRTEVNCYVVVFTMPDGTQYALPATGAIQMATNIANCAIEVDNANQMRGMHN